MKPITKLLVVTFLLFTMVYALPTISHAAIPHTINYQGKLTDKAGKPVADRDDYTVTFKLYDALTGPGTMMPWEQTKTVTTSKGVFSTAIGEPGGINLAFDRQYYLEIVFNGETMAPRQPLTSAAYAFRAENADNATQAQNANVVGNIGVSTTPTANKLLPLDANAKLPLTALPARFQLFTSSGTFTAPPGVTMAILTMCGGGGGGGGGIVNPRDLYAYGSGGGGASSEFLVNVPYAVTPGQSYAVTVGAGGIGGMGTQVPTPAGNGTAGGNTSFGTLTCRGGGGGGGAGVFDAQWEG